jgi:eukaryotic-like serine/threonine-protein kinase
MPLPLSMTKDQATQLLGSRFTVGEELGVGGQGVVFRARRTALRDGTLTDDDVALKIHLDLQQDERIAREIAVMERLRHPCLANLFEHGVVPVGSDRVRYIAWEFIEGEPLIDRILHGPLAPKVVAVIGRDVATALVHIWAERVVHRDVNPKNIMLHKGDQGAVLIDLGAARHLDQSAITTAGFAWGTPGYMSPEQAAGDPQLTCFSDIFALGLTMVEALTGRHPTGRRQALLSSNVITPSTFLGTAPTGLTQLLDRMLARRPTFRPSPHVIAERLAALVFQL